MTGIEQRLRRVEDQLAIARLVASYGPLVDAADADGAAALWTEDGSYAVEDRHMSSRNEIRAMVASAEHGALVSAGCAHFLGPAVVSVDGDDAVAMCESLLVARTESGLRVLRASANRFHLVRRDDGWAISRRTTRSLDGSVAAHELLEVSR